jgi:transcriptional regulator with XRE-family HTH domain
MKLRISTLGKSGHHIGINMRLNCSRSLSVRLLRKPGNPKNMTQEELAQKIGVQRAQVSKIESGRNLTLSTVARVFRAMGMEASLSIAGFGSITL